MEQREAEHMDQVSNQLSTLKAMMDMQAITQSDVPITSMITLGSRELPYFITARSFGEISIQNLDDSYISIDYAIPGGPFYYELTSLRFKSYNAYFVDQIYALEGGSIIVKQENGQSVMRADPSISVDTIGDIDIHLKLPILVDTPGKNSTQGLGKCFIRTNYSEGDSDSIGNVNSIYIATQYPNAWNESFYNLLGDEVNYEKGEDYVEITWKSDPLNVIIEYYYIKVQIGPGWIK